MKKTFRGGARGTVGLTVLAVAASLLGIVALDWTRGTAADFLGEASAEVASVPAAPLGQNTPPKSPAPVDPAGSAGFDPARVEGHKLCIDCHRSEVTACAHACHPVHISSESNRRAARANERGGD